MGSPFFATHRNADDRNGRASNPGRSGLPCSSVDPYATGCGDIEVDMLDPSKDFRAVADDVRTGNRRGDASVFDEKAFRKRTNEVSAGNIDLSSINVLGTFSNVVRSEAIPNGFMRQDSAISGARTISNVPAGAECVWNNPSA